MSASAVTSCAKNNEKSYINTPNSKLALHKTDKLNNIVVMSGSAKRKRSEPKQNYSATKTNQKNNFRGSLFNLRAPLYKSHQKQAQTEEKLTTKSCEILFECIKPYKNIRLARKTQVTQTVRTKGTIGSILTTNIVYEKKAIRKVQFFTFSEENSMQSFITQEQNFLPKGEEEAHAILERLEAEDVMEPGKTVSSEDFITNVFSNPRLINSGKLLEDASTISSSADRQKSIQE